MQTVQSCSKPISIITLLIPFGTTPSVLSSLRRLKGCIGDAFRADCICILFDGSQTTENAVRTVTQRILTKEQVVNVKPNLTTHWEFTITFIFDTDGNSRKIFADKLQKMLPGRVSLAWKGEKKVRVMSAAEPADDFPHRIVETRFTN
jgi:hypothetical protein